MACAQTRHPEVLAKRASKEERPRCCSRAVALRGLCCAEAPLGDGETWQILPLFFTED
jgi:hypothetical protein